MKIPQIYEYDLEFGLIRIWIQETPTEFFQVIEYQTLNDIWPNSNMQICRNAEKYTSIYGCMRLWKEVNIKRRFNTNEKQ